MRFDWRNEGPILALLAGMFLLAGLSWQGAPERIPVHWNMEMQPDRYGGRFEGLLALPLVALGLYLLLLWLPRIDPGRANYAAFWTAFTWLRLTLVAFLAVIYVVSHLWMRGVQVNLNVMMPLLMGVLFIVVGNLLGKVRPNWFVGIRTPWTLSSKVSWIRTHRLGGWVFVVAGLAFMAASLVRTEWAMWTASAILMAGVIATTVYSYFVWRSDPDKVPPAGTTPA